MTNFLILLPLKTTQAIDVCTATWNGYINYFGSPLQIIGNEDPAFMSCMTLHFSNGLALRLSLDVSLITNTS